MKIQKINTGIIITKTAKIENDAAFWRSKGNRTRYFEGNEV